MFCDVPYDGCKWIECKYILSMENSKWKIFTKYMYRNIFIILGYFFCGTGPEKGAKSKPNIAKTTEHQVEYHKWFHFK